MLKISIKYLNYEKIIRIDVKSNSEDNNDLYVHIISDIKWDTDLSFRKTFEHPWMKKGCSFFNRNKIAAYNSYYCLQSHELIGKILDCLVKNEAKASDLFDNKLIQWYHQYYGYSVNQLIDNSSMVNSYYINADSTKSHCEINMKLFCSFKLSKDNFEKRFKTNSDLFKLLIRKWYNLEKLNSDLTLSLYNNMK